MSWRTFGSGGSRTVPTGLRGRLGVRAGQRRRRSSHGDLPVRDLRRRANPIPAHGGALRSMSFISVATVSFCLILGTSLVVPALPLITETYALSLAHGGLFISSFSVGRLLFDVAGGLLGDRVGVRRVALSACVGTALVSVVGALSPSYPLMLAVRVAQGIGSALYMTAAFAHVLSLVPSASAGRLIATYQAVMLAGMSLGPLVGGVVTDVWGVPGPFLVYAGFGVLGLVASYRWLPSNKKAVLRVNERLGVGATLRPLVVEMTFLLSMLGAFALFSARAGIVNALIPLYTEDVLGLSATEIGMLLTVFGVGSLVIMRHAGIIIDRSGRRSVLVLSLIAMGLLTAVVPFVHALGLLAVVAALGAAKGYGAVVPGAVVADVAAPTNLGTAIGLQRTVMDGGMVLGPYLTGAISDEFGFPTTFVVTGLALALIGLLLCRMKETLRTDEEVVAP